MFCQLFSLQNKSFLYLQHVENKGFQTVIKHRLKAIQKPIKNELEKREKNTKNAHFVLKKCTFRFRDYNSNPDANILFPMLFVVISCGAISGFHATQSPLMARCMANEKYARPVFYGAMVSEGVVALIWATAAIAYFGGPEGLNAAADAGKTPAVMVNEICNSWLGRVGAVLAILGVVACPITSGDTAFRSMRLIVAQAFRFSQKKLVSRLMVSVPIFVVAYVCCFMDFSTIWKYVGISNQILATVTLWTAAAFLARSGKVHWIMTVPAMFLTDVCVCYLCVAPYKVGGLAMPQVVGNVAGIVVAFALLALFLYKMRRR